jgi:hypothetical protein
MLPSMRTTVRLRSELLKRARERAAADGRTLTSLIEEGLGVVLDKPGPARTHKVGSLFPAPAAVCCPAWISLARAISKTL